MTEKELKKLSRLELLELLLEVSTENQDLKDRIEKLNAELNTNRNVEQLATAIGRVENALMHADRLTAMMKATLCENDKINTSDQEPSLLDKEIYRCLLHLYAEDKKLLSALPLELQIAIEERVKAY